MILRAGLIAGLLLATPAWSQETFGLVIGIDDYSYVTDLHGAVNDARDIADALEGLGADVTLLLDGAATRAAILGSWDRILQGAQPGDQLIVSFAGHGSNEPEQTPGSERDGRDENFLLAGFAPRGAAAGERIRDDEIAELLARSAALNVIFVADACHAGSVTRDIDPVLGFRYVEGGGIEADPLPPPPPPSSPSEGQDNVALFLAAVDETQRVPEVLIDGVPRGALSYAFADGLRGAADRDGDGVLSKGEMVRHVRSIVRAASDGIQLPQSSPAGQETLPLITLSAAESAEPMEQAVPPVAQQEAMPESTPVVLPVIAPVTPPLTELSFDALPPLAVSGQDWPALAGIAPSDFGTLRRDGLALYSGVGDHVATAHDLGGLQQVIDAQRVAAAIRDLAALPLSVSFGRGDRLYAAREPLSIQINGRRTAYVTLVNLTASGTVTYLYPIADLGDPAQIPASHRINLAVEVTAPFGADHIIAIETEGAAPSLRAALQDVDDAQTLWETLRGSGARVAAFPFFTAERSGQ